jgi:hypothetical protein
MDTDKIYEQAGIACVKTPDELKAMAEGIFATMLYHSLRTSGAVWTVTRLVDGRLELEVNVPPRLPCRRL